MKKGYFHSKKSAEKKRKTEILSPAGSFESAIYAFKAGADAVYLGLKNFSARFSAVNFDYDELLRLKTVAKEQKKKIFVTINTIIKEKELPEIIKTLLMLKNAEIDGVIIQDLGLAKIIKDFFPTLKLHASTQLSVHNLSGVKELEKLGFSRVVLARELSFEQIAFLRKQTKIELEVFIHGALCYSFSGMCLASGMLYNRSGNRGKCAQVCREDFSNEKFQGHLFSCNDLALKTKIKKLIKLGIDSLKIEGRMKAPQYVFNTTALYKSILENKEYSSFDKASRTAFSRIQTTPYFDTNKGDKLISSDFPGHRGTFLGTVEKKSRISFFIKLNQEVAIKDGLQFFKNFGKTSKPEIFSVKKIIFNNKEINFARKNSFVEIITDSKIPSIGEEIFKVSSRNNDLKAINPKSFKIFKREIDLNFKISNNEISVETTLETQTFKQTLKINVEESQKGADLKLVLEKLFNQTDKLNLKPKNIKLENLSNFKTPFIPPSTLKKFKNDFYAKFENFEDKIAKTIFNQMDNYSKILEKKVDTQPFEERKKINPNGILPFAFEEDFLNINKFTKINNFIVVPLAPILFDEKTYLEKAKKMILENKNQQFLFGINNIAHLNFAKQTEKLENAFFFIDFFQYCANSQSLLFFQQALKEKLLFAYSWIEEEIDFSNDFCVKITNFNPPLFISSGCFVKANLTNNICAKNCKKDFEFDLKKSNGDFIVKVKNCTTYLFKKEEK